MDKINQHFLKAASIVEQQIDTEIEKLEKLDDLDKIRAERLSKLKEETQQRKEWLQLGHGQYEEIAEESNFFKIIKKSKNVIVHFFRREAPRSKIFDHHLKILAPKHIETLFVKFDAERCPFLTERLQIKVLPMLLIVISGKAKDRIIGFSELGNRDDFSTNDLERRLALSTVIDYDGDLELFDLRRDSKKNQKTKKHTIRSSQQDSDSDDLF